MLLPFLRNIALVAIVVAFSVCLAAQILTVPNGGTGQATLPAHSPLLGNGAGPLSTVVPPASAGLCLVSGGPTVDPVWATCPGGGGGGGSANFAPNAIQYATSTSVARATIFNDIVSLFGSCSGVLYLGADGNCHASGSGTVTNATGPLVANAILIGNGANDAIGDTVATLDGNGNQILTSSQTTGDAIHPGLISLASNTTDNTLPINTFSISGSLIASMTAWGIRFPATIPASGLCFKTGTPTAGNMVPVTFATCGTGGGGAEPWRVIKLSVQQGGVAGSPAGCSIGWDMPSTGYPTGYAFIGDATHMTRCGAQFAAGAYMSTVLSLPFSYVANTALTFRVSWLHPAAITGTDTWGYELVCQTPTSATATAQPALSAEIDAAGTTVNGTAGQFSTVDLVVTPNSGGVSACSPLDELQLRLILHTTTGTSDNPVLMYAAWKDQ